MPAQIRCLFPPKSLSQLLTHPILYFVPHLADIFAIMGFPAQPLPVRQITQPPGFCRTLLPVSAYYLLPYLPSFPSSAPFQLPTSWSLRHFCFGAEYVGFLQGFPLHQPGIWAKTFWCV